MPAMLVPTSRMPSARPRLRTNHMLIARVQVTGVEPMPTTPTSAHSPYHAASVGGMKANSANASPKAISEAMATGRTPHLSAAPP